MEKKIALITGATGFIGNTLCAQLINAGFYVRALTRQLSLTPKEKNNIGWVCGDVTKPPTLTGVCADIDVVFHCAGFAHAFEEENPNFATLHQQVNYQGTVNLLNEAIAAGVKRFIYFSSIKACADASVPVDETWEAWPSDAYGI